MKNHINTIIVCVSVIICVSIFSGSIVALKTAQNDYIVVTGSATKSFASDRIVWRDSFSEKAQTSKEAFAKLKSDTTAVKDYLINNGVNVNEIVFSSLNNYRLKPRPCLNFCVNSNFIFRTEPVHYQI
jgi:hypothetical protein